MRRQVARVIMAVTVATVLALGAPLAIVVARFYEQETTVRLQRRAALAIGEVTLPLDAATVALALTEPDDPPDVTVYDLAGTRLTGPGPAHADRAVLQALAGQPASRNDGGELVVASPINDRSSERVVGAVRVTSSWRAIWFQIGRAWLVMGTVAVGALVGAWILARWGALRLARPIAALADQANRLGDGHLPTRPVVSGVAEIDAVAGALHNSSVRLVEALARERSYSAEVSHQLRTPLTRLRLGLEKARARPTTSDAALADATAEALADALAEIDQLDATIDYLAALARDRVPGGAVSEPGSVTLDAARRWSQTFEDAGRTLEATVGRDVVAVSASAGGLGQVLDVLLDNALRHGAGSVRLSAHGVAGGSAIEVSDEGTTLAAIANETLFGHRPLEGHGIGLALARAIVEAEDGRLLLVSRSPTTFRMIFPAHETAEDDGVA